MAIQIYRNITVDFSNSRYVIINAKRYDSRSRYIRITCNNEGKKVDLDPNENSAFVRFQKPDGYEAFNKCVISDNGKIILELTEQMLATIGTSYADVVILDAPHSDINNDITIIDSEGRIIANSGSILSTMIFYINVIDKPLDSEKIVSTDEFDALNELLVRANIDYHYLADEVKEQTEEYMSLAEQYKNQAKTYSENASASATASKNSEDAAREAEYNAKTYKNDALAYRNYASTYASNAQTSAANAEVYKNQAKTYSDNSATSAQDSLNYSKFAQSYAVGTGGARTGEATDNAKYYSNQAKAYSESASQSEQETKQSLQDAKDYISGKYTDAVDEVNNIVSNAQDDIDQSIDEVKTILQDNIDTSNNILTQVKAETAQSKTNADNALASKNDAKTYRDEAEQFAQNASDSKDSAKTSEDNAKISENNAKDSADYIDTRVVDAEKAADNAEQSALQAEQSVDNIAGYEQSCAEYAKEAKSYAVGGTDFRQDEDTDNAAYYYDQILKMWGAVDGISPMGTITFEQLPLQTKQKGFMYNISNAFDSDDTFKDGGGIHYPAGTNVYYTPDGLWDCFAGSLVSGIKGNSESKYRNGNVNITPANIGCYDKTEVDNLVQTLQNTIDDLTNRIIELESINNNYTLLALNEDNTDTNIDNDDGD